MTLVRVEFRRLLKLHSTSPLTKFQFHNTSATKTPLSALQCATLINACAKTKSLHNAQKLHAHIISCGHDGPRLLTFLASTYAFCGDADTARLILQHVVRPQTSFAWNSVIRGCTHSGLSDHALLLFDEMLSFGPSPDNFTFPFVLKACGDLSLLHHGMEIHCKAVAAGFEEDLYLQNSLIAMYMKCGEKAIASKVFDRMPERTVVSWNTMIAGNFNNGCAEDALLVFERMRGVCVEPDCATVVSVLPVCAHLKDLRRGREVHELIDGKAFGSYVAVRNSLVDMYAKCGELELARKLFDEMPERDVVSWTTIVGGYVVNGFVRDALILSHQMQLSGIRPNSTTMATLLSACASLSSLKHGKCVHGSCIRYGLESDVSVETALIDMYAKCRHVNLSYRVFARTSRVRTVPWNAIISGCTQNGLAGEAVILFKSMRLEEINPNYATVICLVPAYADLGDLRQVDSIYSYLIRSGFHPQVEITTGLIDVYSKTGGLDSARKLFDAIPDKDIVSWTAIIAGYGMHGHGREAILLFDEMLKSGVEPNEITFTSILFACSHTGLVEEGLHFFNSMVENHQMRPRLDHYACIVDLLGRAGRLEEAHCLSKTMPFKPNHAVWGALLGACVIYKNVELGEVAAEHLFRMEPENTGNYVLLANIYAAVGRWEDAETVRCMMNERGLRKTPGCSLIEVRNMACAAPSTDTSRAEQFYRSYASSSS